MRFEFNGQRVVPTQLQNTQAVFVDEKRIGEFVLPRPEKNESHIVFRDYRRWRDTIYKVKNGSGEIAYFSNGGGLRWEIAVDRQPIIEVSTGRVWSAAAYRNDPVGELLNALDHHDLTVMSKLLNANPSLSNVIYPGGLTLLMMSNDPRITRMALDAGANVNARDVNGSSPLHYAAYYGFTEIAELLINGKADVNARNAAGDTPLHVAMQRRQEAVGDYLIKRGADSSAINGAGLTPLGAALRY